MKSNWLELFDKTGLGFDALYENARDLFYSDLHAIPFKGKILERIEDLDTILSESQNYAIDFTTTFIGDPYKLAERKRFTNRLISDDIEKSLKTPRAFFFFTRPFSVLELSLILNSWATSEDQLEIFKSTITLFKLTFSKKSLKLEQKNDNEGNTENFSKVTIGGNNWDIDRSFALTSFQTEDSSWGAVVKNKSIEPDRSRYRRLFDLVNQILKCRTENQINYIVFPELSIPRKLLVYLATKLKNKGISLIAGLEYKIGPNKQGRPSKKIVSNQLAYVLSLNSSSFSDQVCLVQEKVFPALHEERDLFQIGGKILKAKDKQKYIINHGGLYFGGLICNDLLNIDYRQMLRGKIDTLIVIEWNKDVETYDSLVSSTANDLHCFVLQVNNRQYGDTRLRAPYKESYKRDRVRVRGGDMDFFVISSIETNKLRIFQDTHRSGPDLFKCNS